MICFAFPLAHEAGLVLKTCTEKNRSPSTGSIAHWAISARVACWSRSSAWAEAQARTTPQTIFEHFRLKALILAGYGGALVPPMKVGQVAVSANFTSEAVLGFLRMLSGFDFASFCTVDEVAGTVEKGAGTRTL